MSFLNIGGNKRWEVTFSKIPISLADLQTLPEASLKEPYYAAALLIPALRLWPENKDEAINMINYLRGPGPMSPYDIQFISERLRGYEYIANSFFNGASPENGYEPKPPYIVVVSSVPNSFAEDGYGILYLQSGGADSPRPVKLRKKPSTGEWFLTDQMLLSQIRIPVSADPWA